MFEHFQADAQEKFQLEQHDTDELVEIVAEVTGIEEYDESLASLTKEQLSNTFNGLALMAFRAGRAFQEAQTDKQFVTVHLPVDKAGKFIEALIAEAD